MADIYITPHALARYMSRVRSPDIGYHRALHELEYQVAHGHKTGNLPSGLEQWRGPRPLRIRFRVDTSCEPHAVVTVLADHDGMREERD
jgi:hypothetical protein